MASLFPLTIANCKSGNGVRPAGGFKKFIPSLRLFTSGVQASDAMLSTGLLTSVFGLTLGTVVSGEAIGNFWLDAAGVGGLTGWDVDAGLADSSVVFLFLLDDSFSALSRTTFAILSNSEHMLSMRFVPPLSSCPSEPSIDKKFTTTFINFTSALDLGSWGFCSMFPNRVTRAETGK